jgi:hypothetical protein
MTSIKDALEDCLSHRHAWWNAIESARDRASNDADESYWRHELAAFNRTFDSLATLTPPAPGRDAWSYQIQHGPDGEANYAWVHDHNGDLVCTAKTHHAKQIVDAILSALPVAPVVDEAAIRADEREKCDRFVGALWTDLFDNDLVKSEGADTFDKWRERIRAGDGER